MGPEIPRGALVVMTPEGALALAPEVAEEPQAELKRAVYEQLQALGVRAPILTALVFVIEADEQEVEMCRDEVRAEDLPALARAYWYLPSWRQRTALVNLVIDHADACLAPIWSDILRAPKRHDGDARHYAKVAAIWRMAGSPGDMFDFDDDDLVQTTSAALAETTTVPPWLA